MREFKKMYLQNYHNWWFIVATAYGFLVNSWTVTLILLVVVEALKLSLLMFNAAAVTLWDNLFFFLVCPAAVCVLLLSDRAALQPVMTALLILLRIIVWAMVSTFFYAISEVLPARNCAIEPLRRYQRTQINYSQLDWAGEVSQLSSIGMQNFIKIFALCHAWFCLGASVLAPLFFVR